MRLINLGVEYRNRRRAVNQERARDGLSLALDAVEGAAGAPGLDDEELLVGADGGADDLVEGEAEEMEGLGRVLGLDEAAELAGVGDLDRMAGDLHVTV